MFHGGLKSAVRAFQGCFKKVSCCMALIAASRAEGGLVPVKSGAKKCLNSVIRMNIQGTSSNKEFKSNIGFY